MSSPFWFQQDELAPAPGMSVASSGDNNVVRRTGGAHPSLVGTSDTGLANQGHFYQRANTHLFTQKHRDFAKLGGNDTERDEFRNVVQYDIQRTPVSEAFFSSANIQLLKTQLVSLVKKRSKGAYKINARTQSTSELVTAMRECFLDNARHLPDNIKGQVRDLNQKVLQELVPIVMNNIAMHLTYMRDRTNGHTFLDRPQYMASAGTRTDPLGPQQFI